MVPSVAWAKEGFSPETFRAAEGRPSSKALSRGTIFTGVRPIEVHLGLPVHQFEIRCEPASCTGSPHPKKTQDNAALENRLWDAADQFRANSGLKSQEYSAPVLGLIFLRFAEVRFAAQRAKLESPS
jgi:hypothetical protein